MNSDHFGNHSAGQRGWGPAFGIIAIILLMLWDHLV